MNQPIYVIALTGPSAAGKTTVGHYFSQNFPDDFEHVRQDDYHIRVAFDGVLFYPVNW